MTKHQGARRDAFYRAREDAIALGEAFPTFRWTSDGNAVAWRVGGNEKQIRLRGGASGPASLEATESPRLFMRETYLVPEWPMPEAPSRDGRWFASIHGGEVCVRRTGEDETSALTTGATADVGWDLEAAAASPWSPDGRWLFANAVDRRAVSRTLRTRFSASGAVSSDAPRVQRAGGAIDRLLPHLVPREGGAPRPLVSRWLEDKIVRLVGWSPEGDTVMFACFSRTLDFVELMVADLYDGRARTVYSERSPTFLRSSTIVWTSPVGCWPLKGRRFLWISEQDGWAHLFLGAQDGEQLTQITTGRMVVHDVVHHDDHHTWFMASQDGPRPYDRHLFKASLTGGEAIRLTEGEGEHRITFSPDGAHFVDVWSAPDRPPKATVQTSGGAHVARIDAFKSPHPLGPTWTAPKSVSLLAADGSTPIHGVLYRPPAMKPGRRCPVVHWVYGGPQMTVTPRIFGPSNGNEVLLHALAQLGYAVLVLDARGTPGRSKDFQDVVWRNFAPNVVADQIGALRQLLATEPWLDPERLGIMGRSWGAHFALRMMAAAPDLYRAGVLVVPGLDPYGGLIYEPYLGLPQLDPEPYRAAEPWAIPSTLAKDARLLLMAGTLDSPCQWDLQRLSTLLVEADIGHYSLVFAEQEHVFAGAAERFHDRSAFEFFEANLT